MWVSEVGSWKLGIWAILHLPAHLPNRPQTTEATPSPSHKKGVGSETEQPGNKLLSMPTWHAGATGRLACVSPHRPCQNMLSLHMQHLHCKLTPIQDPDALITTRLAANSLGKQQRTAHVLWLLHQSERTGRRCWLLVLDGSSSSHCSQHQRMQDLTLFIL